MPGVFLKKVVHVVIGCFIVAVLIVLLSGSVNISAKARLGKKSVALQVGDSGT